MFALEVTCVVFSRFVFRAVQLRWDLSNPCNSRRILDMFLMTRCRFIPKMFCYRNDYVRCVGAREIFKEVNRTCKLPATGDKHRPQRERER